MAGCDASPPRRSGLLSVAEALEAIVAEARPLPAVSTPLDEALGLVLAESVASDVDLPPFPRVTMDGWAARAGAAPLTLRIAGVVHAGEEHRGELGEGEAVKVMTGAPLPRGAAGVVQVERARADADTVTLLDPVTPGRNVAQQGEDLRRGEVVLEAGARIGEAEVALLATAGCASVRAVRAPRAAVLSTGDELVDVAEAPGPAQIRNSNAPMLAAVARTLGCREVDVIPPARDEERALAAALERGLAADVILVSGGVSAGDRDLVGATLERLGVRPLFHGVSIQPGKPLWFGRTRTCLVLGLPGNPVSSLVTSRLFAGTAVRGLRGLADPRPRRVAGRLARAVSRNPGREGWLPARVAWHSDGFSVEPLEGRGSGDLVTTARANALWVAPQGIAAFAAGETVEALLAPDWPERPSSDGLAARG